MKKLLFAVATAILICMLYAQTTHGLWLRVTQPSAPQKVRIATREVAPYFMREDHAGGRCLGRNLLKAFDETEAKEQYYCGYLVDIFLEKYSSTSEYAFSIKREDNASKMLALLDDTKTSWPYDLGLANVTITDQRKEQVLFSDPVASGGLGVMVKLQSNLEPSDFWLGTKDVVERQGWGLIIVVLVLLLLAFVMWKIERRNPKASPRLKVWPLGYYRQAFKLATIFISQGANSYPRSVVSRGLVLIWMVFALLTITSFGVALGLALEARRTSGVTTKEDLKRKQVAVIEGTTGEYELRTNTFKPKKLVHVKDIEEAAKKLEDDGQLHSLLFGPEADAFVYDKPALEYFITHGGKGNFKVLDEQLTDEQYALIFPKNDAGRTLSEEFNQTITRLRQNGQLTSLRDSWFKE